MEKQKKYKALPSMILLHDGSAIKLSDVSEEEKKQLCKCICENISEQIRASYTRCPEPWEKLTTNMPRQTKSKDNNVEIPSKLCSPGKKIQEKSTPNTGLEKP